VTGGFELFVAKRYLKAKRKQAVISIITVISIVGVAAGVLALVVALAINNGFRDMLQKSLLGAQAHINVMERVPANGIAGWREMVEKLRKVPHVTSASPTLYGKVYLASTAPELKGIDTRSEVKTSDMLRNLKAGSLKNLDEFRGFPGIILGSDLAQTAGLKVGDVVRVMNPLGEMTPTGIRPKWIDFRVAGIFQSGFYDIDSSWVFTSLKSAQNILSTGDVINDIELKLDDIYRAPEVAKAVEKVTGPRLSAATWMELNRPILNALKMEKTVTVVTIGLIVLVAALNILITLIMMVMEKYRDIAILVSMGARQQQVRRIFMAQGVLIGTVGTAIGLAVAHVLCYFADKYHWIRLDETVYSFGYVPFDPRWVDSIWIAAMAILIAFLATLYPARNASRIAPAEALRYE
jgi:lipoprotein-releasing system permease protein